MSINFRFGTKSIACVASLLLTSVLHAQTHTIDIARDDYKTSTTVQTDPSRVATAYIDRHTRFSNDTLILELNTSSVAAYQAGSILNQAAFQSNDGSQLTRLRAYQNRVLDEQKVLSDQLVSAGLVSSVVSSISYTNNVLVVKAKLTNMDAILALSDVKSVHRQEFFAPVTTTEDIKDIKADLVWNLLDDNDNNITGVGTKIAILDTGIDYTHANLGGCFGEGCKVAGGYDIYNDDADPLESSDDPYYRFLGHGTHVAAIAAGKQDEQNNGFNGVAPDAQIYAYKVCGEELCSTSDILTGLDMAANPDGDITTDDAVDVINLSLGSRFGQSTDIMPTTINQLSNLGMVVVVAAGNDGGFANIGGIASAQEGISVAASYREGYTQFRTGDTSDGINVFSSLGPVAGLDYLKPDISAPGTEINSACTTAADGDKNPYCVLSGTSMASPHVAGVAALLKQAKPTLSTRQLKSLIINTARSFEDTDRAAQGGGKVNAEAAATGTLSFEPAIAYFGDINTQQDIWETQQTIVITNHEQTDSQLSLSIVDPSIEGLTISLSQGASLIIPADTQATISVQLRLDLASFNPNQSDHLVLSQRIKIDDDKRSYYVPVSFSKMISKNLLYSSTYPIELSIYNKDNNRYFKTETYGFSDAYLPMGNYGAFAMFPVYGDQTDYKLVAIDNIAFNENDNGNIVITEASARHKISLNDIRLANGELAQPTGENLFLFELLDSQAKYFSLYGGSNRPNMSLIGSDLYVSDLPDHLELRLTGVIQQLDNSEAPSTGDYLVFNKRFLGLDSQDIFDINFADYTRQQISFDNYPQNHTTIDNDTAVYSPSVGVDSSARYPYSSNVYGVFDPRRRSFTSGNGVLSRFKAEDNSTLHIDTPFEMNVYVMPRDDQNNQALGLYNIENFIHSDLGFAFQTLFKTAQIDDTNSLVLWTRAEFFSDNSFLAPLAKMTASLNISNEQVQNITRFNATLVKQTDAEYLSVYDSRYNMFGSSDFNYFEGNEYEALCNDSSSNEQSNNIYLVGPCDTYSASVNHLNSFLDSQTFSSYELTMDTLSQNDRKTGPSIAYMYVTQDEQLVSHANGQNAQLNIATTTALTEVQVALKGDGDWINLDAAPSDKQTNLYVAEFAVPDKQVKHHVRVTMISEGAQAIQTNSSFMLAGRDNAVILSEDYDQDGLPDYKDPDGDNDDVDDLIDAMPYDETESTDTDGDGIGNNADTDDDGDGIDDINDAFPLDNTESVDTDGDGIGNNADADDDGDGADDINDAFPLDATESLDTDGDGIGNNTDLDDDDDGVNDINDAFPLDASESIDTDGDGIGNNADPDDDGDGVSDANDTFPLDASRSQNPVVVSPPSSGGDGGGGSTSIVVLLALCLVATVRRFDRKNSR